MRKAELAAGGRPRVDTFDPSKVSKLVPRFVEKDVDDYFNHFEKVASNLKWPKDYWPSLLQTVFVGKAREAYTALPDDKCNDYDNVKQAVLKAYELVPEAYRQKFRSWRLTGSQNHVEFAKEKERLFEKWLKSNEVDKNFDKLKQLILLEEFKNCIHPEIKTYLEEHKINTLQVAATRADDYSLTHKLSVKSTSYDNKILYKNNKGSNNDNSSLKSSKPNSFGGNEMSAPPKSNGKDSSNGDTKPKGTKPQCNYCQKVGHIEKYCFKKLNDMKYCDLCNKYGHKSENCYSQKKSETEIVGCTIAQRSISVSPIVVGEAKVSPNVLHKFEPFISDGTVSIDESSDPHPIKILRDTACSQTLVLESVLPFSSESYIGQSVLVQGS